MPKAAIGKMIMQFFKFIGGFIAFVIVSAMCGTGVSSAQELKSVFDQCRGSRDLNIKTQSCSMVIQKSKERAQIERAYNSRGLANMALKNFVNAVQDFTKAIQMDTRNSGYFDNRQGAFFALERFDLALMDVNNAIRLSPKEAFVYHSRGLIYGAIGRYNDAVNDISTAISLDPRWIELFVDRGMIRAKAGQYEAAIFDFNRAIELKSDLIWAFRERGLTYMRMGNRERARSDLSIALRLQPDDIEVIAGLRALEPPSLAGESPKQKDTPPDSSGTGFFVAPKQVLTNNHVIKDCRSTPIRVSYPERRPERAYIVGQDDTNDLALLQTELSNASVASFRFSHG
jgi:tetratricopeptide (TPR) repeat protein